MTRRHPLPTTRCGDRALRQVAAAAAAIVVVALVALAGALLSWHGIATDGAARGSAAAGLTLARAGQAVVVDGVGRDGPAMRAGLRVGDVVEAVNDARVTGVEAADRAIAAPPVDIRVRRGDKAFLIRLPPARRAPLG